MKFKILTTLGIITLIVLGFFFSPFRLSSPSSKDEVIADQVLARAAKKIETTKDLHLIGIGAQMLNEIEMLALSFQCLREVDLNTARELIVYSVQTLMAEVNENEEIRPYLKNYPFTSKNVEIRIFCYQPDASNVALHKLEIISSINGIIKYYPRGPDKYKMEEPILTETYEEALSIINKKEFPNKISILPFEKDYIEEFDIGFKKWILIFENFKPAETYSCEMSRPFPQDPSQANVFVPIKDYMTPPQNQAQEPTIKTHSGRAPEFLKQHSIVIISEKGFLPGEKITIRTKTCNSSDYTTISFCPRPIIINDAQGKELLSAELINITPAIYCLNFSFNPNNRLVRFYSISGKETLNNFFFQEGPLFIQHIPDTITETGGISSLQLTYQNGDFYEVKLPWGLEFIHYTLGSYKTSESYRVSQNEMQKTTTCD